MLFKPVQNRRKESSMDQKGKPDDGWMTPNDGRYGSTAKVDDRDGQVVAPPSGTDQV